MTEELNIPDEIRREIIDIINDSPTLQKVGDHEYRVYRLRAYSLNRIFQVAIKLRKEDPNITDDTKMMYAMCTDIEGCAEIVAIILCNHLFKADDVTDYQSALDTMDRNDKLIQFMKTRVLMSTIDTHQWAAIIMAAIQSIDLSTVFMSLKLVDDLMISTTNLRKATVEQFKYWQTAKQETSPIVLNPSLK